jgi:hypothetical protein
MFVRTRIKLKMLYPVKKKPLLNLISLLTGTDVRYYTRNESYTCIRNYRYWKTSFY